jgi:hypothetical protein
MRPFQAGGQEARQKLRLKNDGTGSLLISIKQSRSKARIFFASSSQFAGRSMADLFAVQIDWASVAMAIGAVASIVGAVFYGRPSHD